MRFDWQALTNREEENGAVSSQRAGNAVGIHNSVPTAQRKVERQEEDEQKMPKVRNRFKWMPGTNVPVIVYLYYT